MEKICVAVRVRPPVASQESIHGMFWNIRDNHISLHKDSGTPISGVSYSFDHVFDQTCPNSRVYDLLTKDIIRAALEGFNGTVFAYGQTSSGKTFTMNGSENDPGVIHRAVKDIFDMIQAHEEREFLIRVSYMEIYNEEINDLLVLHSQKLPIHESLERGVFVAGLREEIVNNAEQVHKLLEAGEVNRHFGETNMNVRSSRSHTIFRMVIESKSKEIDSSKGYSSSDAIRVSVLNLVDLAGSERIAKTGADGVRLKEGKHINKSLMVLGNVINKLSEGPKQRGHIPYRDSKLTRILQSALGGNAKTSIICTVAPEEVHVEETKGTLQFANRAKRVTNCAQVNEILTDAALLKRQKLEIEELRQKLQGSMAEVLEQEVLKLRNDLLKYELEREKLATELEEERRLLRQRDEHMKEQQIKIENLSNLVNSSASHQKSYSQKEDLSRCISERSSSSLPMWQEDALSTPGPNSFVMKRSNYTTCDGDLSPLPDAFNNVVDENLWMKMNKGFVADLDSIQMTPAVKTRSLSSDGISPGFSKDRYELEIQNLKRQMELAVKEREELEKRHREQLLVNNQLTEEIVKLEGEVKLSGEIPQMLCKSVSTCKEIYKDVLSVMQSSVADEKSFANQLLSSMSEIGTNLFTTLETCCTMDRDGLRTFSSDNSIVKEQCKLLCEKLNSTIALLASSEVSSTEEKELSTRSSCDYKGLDFEGDPACWKEKLSDVLNTIRDKYTCLEKDVDPSSQVLEDSKARYIDLEREFTVLKEENESLLDKVSKATENLKTVSEQKEMFLEKYTNEAQLRKGLEEGIHILKEERGSLLDKVSNLTENLRTVSDQREMLLEKYNDVMQKRKDLEEGISVLKEERDTLLDKESRLSENLQTVSEQREIFLEKYDDAMQRRKDLEEGINVLKEERDTLLDKVSTLSENLQTVSEQRELFLEKYNDAMQRRKELEEGINVLKEERNTLLEKLSKSTENLETVSEQREMFLKKYNNEVQRRKDLEEGIKRVNAAFASRQKSLVSFHSNLKSRVECLRAKNPVVVSNSLVS